MLLIYCVGVCVWKSAGNGVNHVADESVPKCHLFANRLTMKMQCLQCGMSVGLDIQISISNVKWHPPTKKGYLSSYAPRTLYRLIFHKSAEIMCMCIHCRHLKNCWIVCNLVQIGESIKLIEREIDAARPRCCFYFQYGYLHFSFKLLLELNYILFLREKSHPFEIKSALCSFLHSYLCMLL